MNYLEFVILAKIALVLILAFSFIGTWTKNALAQASILESTPTGTSFCTMANAQSSVDMSACADAMMIPMGTTGQRPLSPVSGMIRYNMGSSNIEAYSGSAWWAMVPLPTNVSAFTNDVPYLATSVAASTYATQSSLTSGLSTKQATITLGTSGQYVNGTLSLVNFPTIPAVQSYEGTTQRLNPILINKTATVAGSAGNAVFNLTNDGTSTGTALCPNGVMLNSPNLSVNDATAPYQFSWAWTNSNKTMTVLAQKASGLAVLTFTLLGIPAPVPNGTNVNATAICY